MIRSLPLSSLVASRRNPRRTKPDKEAHRQLVATIRAFGLLEPLIVRPTSDDPDHYMVIAGHRRLAALKEVHRGQEPKVPCVIKDVDDMTAGALALTENFTQKAMHPLDEATAFAELASTDASGIEAVTAKFGVTERYVKQRIKLASLTRDIKAAYHEGRINTAIAEAFACVPEDRQRQVWQEMRGEPRQAQQVRNIIANGWIDASHALFDIAALPDNAVNRDLFSEQVLVERTAFMEAQAQANEVQRRALVEQGWSAAVACSQQDAFSHMAGMDELPPEYDAKTTRKLAKLQERRETLEASFEKVEGNSEAVQKLEQKLETLHTAECELEKNATVEYSEATKATGTVFLILDSEGRVHQKFAVARSRSGQTGANGSSNGQGETDGEAQPLEQPKVPTSVDLNDRQLASAYTHHTLAVREALLENPLVCKRLLVMILHPNIHAEALAIRNDANGVTLHATGTEGFTSPVWGRLAERHRKIDPLAESNTLLDAEAYKKVSKLTAAKLDALIELLLVETLTAHATRPTVLVQQLATELKVDARKDWRPDRTWLANYQKSQLAHLLADLCGPAYDPAHETRKKSELVDALAQLFADAAEGKVEDRKLADRVNRWLPQNLRREVTE